LIVQEEPDRVAQHPLFVTFFMAGAFVFLIGILLRVFIYWQAQWNPRALLKGFFSTLFSRRIGTVIEVILLDGVLQRRLFSQDKLRWAMKVLIMVGYPGILIAGHLKAETMAAFENLPHLIRFFYAPFSDFYYFQRVSGSSMGVQGALFAIFFDLFGAMILAGELIAVYRRFLAKAVPFKTSAGDIVAVNLLGGWFILRFFCEATSILAYAIPGSIARYWFVSYGLSRVLAPLGLPWSSLNYPVWSLSGLFLAGLFALIPYNRKLWHILTIPGTMFVRLMPRSSFESGTRKRPLALSIKDVIALDSCVSCGSCVDVCPVYAETHRLETTMGGLYKNLKGFVAKTYGLPSILRGTAAPGDVPKEYGEPSYLCTLCGRCKTVCPAFIDTKDLRIAARGLMVEQRAHPRSMDLLAETLETKKNISSEPNENRPLWLEGLPEAPSHGYQRERSRMVYFVGCVASFFPMTKKIPQSFVQILDRAREDFTILGGDEWCCGFPLIGAGMKEQARTFLRHNLQKLKEKGAERAVFSCPSCYHTWKEECGAEIEMFHSTEFIKKLVDDGTIGFKQAGIKVTYHDPCDLGRASGVFDPPRDILHAIPGVELVEMESNREGAICCGGGGNLEMVNPELSAALALAKLEQIKATGAETVVSACQQCVRTILSTARRKKIRIAVMDITEFVLKNMA
jgi:heterodisulfide reductase subunit D